MTRCVQRGLEDSETPSLSSAYKDIIRHSAIYGFGHILARLVSIVLLPFYTHHFTPADYGAIAIIDLTLGFLGILVGAGMASAVSRYHFEASGTADRVAVWWTGLAFVAGAALLLLLPLWLARGIFAQVTLGAGVEDGGLYYTLALPTAWCTTVGALGDTYLRVRKWSGVYLAISLGKLLLNLSLNIFFIAQLRMGVAGLLLGNLISSLVSCGSLVTIMCASLGAARFSWVTLRSLLRFGMPLIATALSGLLMHEADRLILRVYHGQEIVGIYSLAYKIGQAVNTLCLLPFSLIWDVVVYEIAHRPDAERVYVLTFKYCVLVLLLVLLAAAMAAGPLISLVAPDAYGPASALVPVVLLAFFFFSLHAHFRVPVLLAKRTVLLLPTHVGALVVNLALNFALVPSLGAHGAAWTSVVTYFTFSFVSLLVYRRIAVYDYPLLRCGAVLLGMALTFVLFRQFCVPRLTGVSLAAVAAGGWLLWGLPLAVLALRSYRRSGAQPAVPIPGVCAASDAEVEIAAALGGNEHELGSGREPDPKRGAR